MQKLSPQELKRQTRELLRKYGDIPKYEVNKAVTDENLDKWSLFCVGNKLVSAVRREKTDWYSTTIKNLVTHPKYRGKGYGTRVVNDAVKKAGRESPVVLADVTIDNWKSRKIFERLGFDVAGKFCWQRGKKPAVILHYAWTPYGKKCIRDPRSGLYPRRKPYKIPRH